MKFFFQLSLAALLLSGGLVSCSKSDSSTPTPTGSTGGNTGGTTGNPNNSQYFKTFTDKDITVRMTQLEYGGKIRNTGSLDYDGEVYIAYDVKRNVPQPFDKHRILTWSVKGADGTVYTVDRELYYSRLDDVGDVQTNSGITVSADQAMDLSTINCVITIQP